MENITNQADKFLKQSKTCFPTLTVKNLGEMIISSIDKQHPQNKNEDRLFEFKRSLLNFLFNCIAKKSGNKDLHRLADLPPLREDENLILYSFFISHNEQFNFEWSYLLSKFDRIEKFLLTFREYINYICNDINDLFKNIPFENNVIFLIDDYLKISYSNDNRNLNAEIQIKEIHKILNCKKDSYTLQIFYNSEIVTSLDRISNIDAKEASKKIQSIINIITHAK